jgi:cytochrome c-type biogenesis protein
MDVGLLFSFSAGLLSVISPCILPLLPIVIGHSLLKRKNRDVFAFILGFFMVFAIITILTIIFTAAINHYLLYFRVLAAILIILMGMVFLLHRNIFRFKIAPRYLNETAGSLVAGFLTCLAWSPCYGPYIVAVAAYGASTGSWLYSAVNMIVFAAGFSVSILLLAVLTSKINFESFLKHSDLIRIISGMIIIFAGIYLLIGYL